jgi:hypothetical protein
MSKLFYATIGKTLPVFEPACGLGHISKVVREYGYNVIEQDLYTDYVSQHIDYLNSIDPLYGILITTPPASRMFEFLFKAFLSGKPFAMLLSIKAYFTVTGSSMFEEYPLAILAFRRNIVFQHNGRPTHVSGMAWFIGNMTPKSDYNGVVQMKYIDMLNVPHGEEDDESFSIVGQDTDEV